MLQTSNLLNPLRNRENTESMVDRKAAVKPAAGRPRAVLGNISNKGAPAARNDGTKVVIVQLLTVTITYICKYESF